MTKGRDWVFASDILHTGRGGTVASFVADILSMVWQLVLRSLAACSL